MDALRRARELERPVERARKALNRAEESLRLNPRRVYASHVPDTLRSGLTALEYAAINVRVTCRALFDRAEAGSHRAARDRDAPGLMADALATAADAVAAFGQLVAPDVAGPRRDDAELRWALTRAQSARDAASRAMSVDPRTEPEIWRLNGAILAHVDRLLADIDPDAEEAARAVRRPETVPSPTTRLRRRTVSMLRVGRLRADRLRAPSR
jgi:hypothetical protein